MTTILHHKQTANLRGLKPLNLIATGLSIYLGTLFLAYCLVFLWVCPRQQLWCAVIFEVALFAISLIWIKQSFTTPSKPHLVKWQWLSKLTDFFTWMRVLFLAGMSLYGSIDFIAMTSAACLNPSLATIAYSILPGSELTGLHPAYSLECLAGAFVERKDLKKAEQLYHSLLEIRQRKCGSSSDLVAALYADLGELGMKQHDLQKAEKWYTKAVELAPSSGRALTGLANTIRDTGRFIQSRPYYLRALDCRAAMFGRHSSQYWETWSGYAKLMEQIHSSRQEYLLPVDAHGLIGEPVTPRNGGRAQYTRNSST